MQALSPSLQLNFPVPTRPTPLEGLLLPPDLSGATGNNRAPNAPTLISATHDLAALVAWLAPYADTPATLQAYRREVERAVNWTVIERGKPFSSLTHEDLLGYERFLANPQPAERWVLAGKKKLARNHPDWRPFAGPLSPSAVRHALVILNACFAWLTEAGYMAGNPLSLARRRRVSSKPRITRYLSHDMWDLVKETIELLPADSDRERQHAVRCRWLFTVFYLGGLRASEVTGTPMGAFFSRRDSKGIERWWLEVTGKGRKTRLVPATDEVMAELATYRRAHGLSVLPHAGETTPLVLPVIGPEKPLTRGASSGPPRTGCDTRPALTWQTGTSTCGTCEIRLAMLRLRPPMRICTAKMTRATRRFRNGTESTGARSAREARRAPPTGLSILNQGYL
jgi:integrase